MTKIDSGSLAERQQNWILRKPAKTSASGTVVSHHTAASEIGARVLREGGNAMDAAIATSFAITVLEPWMSGIGGGGLMTVYSASEKAVRTIHFGMKSPGNLKPEDYVLDEGGIGGDLFSWPKVKGDINVNGWKSIGVPGHLAGIDLAYRRFATKPWASLIEPSITLARRGLPIGWHATLRIASAMGELQKDPAASTIYLPGGVPPTAIAGQKLPYVDLGPLASTFEAIARDGIAAFYDGPLGQSIAKDVQAAGGDLSFEDLQSYQAEERNPLSFEYRGATINTVDGPSAGPTLKHAMALLPTFSGNPDGPSPQDVSAWAIALRESYEERFETLGDVDDSKDPACTTNLVTSDSEGNVVVLTQTLLSIFGAKVVAPTSGILMNNGMMWFDPRPGKPNSIAPNKKPLSNMAPTIVTTSDGLPWFGLGASGGRRIFPCLMQLMSYRIDFAFDIEKTFHSPRIDVCGSNYVGVDPEFSSEVFEALTDVLPVILQEHAVLPAGFAIPSAIEVAFDGTSVLSTGVADPIAPLSSVAVP